MVAIENVLLAAVSVFALALRVIGVFAFLWTREVHLAFLAPPYAVLFVQGLILTF